MFAAVHDLRNEDASPASLPGPDAAICVRRRPAWSKPAPLRAKHSSIGRHSPQAPRRVVYSLPDLAALAD